MEDTGILLVIITSLWTLALAWGAPEESLIPLGTVWMIWGLFGLSKFDATLRQNKRLLLVERVVKLSPAYRKKYELNTQLAKIFHVWSNGDIDIELQPTKKQLVEREKEYKKYFLLSQKNYKNELAIWKKNQKNGLSQQNYDAQYYGYNEYPNYPYGAQPQEPQYDFSPEYSTMRVPKKSYKLLPKKYKILDGVLTKQLETNDPKKKGGKDMKRMPKIFRYAMYLAVVVLVWDVVINANNITLFVVHTFILHK